MTKLLQDVKRATQNMRCSEHQKGAEISISGDKITFNACCENFKTKLTEEMKRASAASAKAQIKDMFKGFGK